MVDTIEPTAAQTEPVKEPTPAPSGGEKKLEFSQKELDDLIKDRLSRAEKSAAKQFQKQIDELTAKVQDFEGKDLGELEKLQKKLEKLTGDYAEKDKELTGATLKIAKMEALLNAGALPAQITKLLKRVSGTTPEEIESDVKELIELGWIGKPKGEPTPEPIKGLGTQTNKGDATPPKSLKERVGEINKKLLDKNLPWREKEDLLKEVTQLNRRISTGDT